MALVADGLQHVDPRGRAPDCGARLLICAPSYTGWRFVFGIGKLGDLVAFSSAFVLVMIARLIS
jgi:hypothetical protein